MSEWRKVDGWPAYEVSRCGKVRRVLPTNEKNKGRPVPYELNPWRSKDGYMYVELYMHPLKSTQKVHRLVAKAFIENPENKPEVAHNDGSKDNNHASNLRWATKKENQADRKRHKTCNGIILKTAGTKNINAKLTDDDVLEIRRRFDGGEKCSHLARKFNIGQSQCHRICHNQSWKWLIPG